MISRPSRWKADVIFPPAIGEAGVRFSRRQAIECQDSRVLKGVQLCRLNPVWLEDGGQAGS
jgi:hypothetical protein